MKTLLVWISLCILWGTTWIFIKLGLADLPPVSFAALRFTVSCFLLLPLVLWQGAGIGKDRSIWKIIVITGILQFFFNYGLLFWGEQFITSGLAAVLQATIPAFGLVLARIFVGEEITGTKIFSILLGITGVAIVFYEQLNIAGALAFAGSLAVVVGAFGASFASVLTKAKLQGLNTVKVVFWQMLIGQIPLWVVGVSVEGSPLNFSWTWQGVICVLYLAVFGSVAAFWLYYWLLSRIDISKAMMISLVTPLVAVYVGGFFGEELNKRIIPGGFLILGSVFLIAVKPILDKTSGLPAK